MFCSLSMTKPIVANANLPQNPDSSSSSSSSSSTPQQLNLPQNQKPSSLAPTNKLRRRRPPQPSITQLERAVGAGSFRDGEPELKMNKDSDIKKTVVDLFLGQAMEGAMQKKLRETGEWLGDNGETRLQSSSSRKGILLFALRWILPIWGISLLIASGAIKLPFSSPFLDDLLL